MTPRWCYSCPSPRCALARAGLSSWVLGGSLCGWPSCNTSTSCSARSWQVSQPSSALSPLSPLLPAVWPFLACRWLLGKITERRLDWVRCFLSLRKCRSTVRFPALECIFTNAEESARCLQVSRKRRNALAPPA